MSITPTTEAADADGEAFRTAARLGLTLRFYGGCAQSSMPGTPSAYEVEPGADRAAAMRTAIARADAVIASGGKAPPAPQPAEPPIAVLRREIGESSWFDHSPIRFGSDEYKAMQRDPHWDYCPVHPATAAPDGDPMARDRRAWLNNADMAALERVDELFQDGEGYDVPAEQMKRMAELGVIRHHNAGRYTITSFGRWVLGSTLLRQPLETSAECNDRLREEHRAALAAKQGGAA